MTAPASETLPRGRHIESLLAHHRIDHLLHARLRRWGRHGWDSLARLAVDQARAEDAANSQAQGIDQAPHLDLAALQEAAVLLTEAGLLETSTQLIGTVRLPPSTIVEIILDERLVDLAASPKARQRVLRRFREPLLSRMSHAVTHDQEATLYTVASLCAPTARREDVVAAAWTAGLALDHAAGDTSQRCVDLCTTALRLHAFNGVVAELYPSATAILR